MKLVKQAKFGSLVMDFYMDENEEIWGTRDQIGTGLNYSEPRKAIEKIHSRNEDRFKGKSVVTKLTTTDGKAYNTTLYNSKGITEICRWARTEKADDFFDWATNVIEEIRKNGMYISPNASHEQITYNVDVFYANINNYAIEKLESLVSDFIDYHRKKKTKLPFERSSKTRHPNKKQEHLESMKNIIDQIVEVINVRMNECVARRQDGLVNELIKIREMCKVKKENMKYRHTATKLGHANRE
ncbi:BRO family protein [Brevibacillus sp. NRS-1366]|uniref:BRO family protein n=1 Tax=Brevibacillus sp. NRS-1366 TaxID=3233899 RepID=UPI003D24FA69